MKAGAVFLWRTEKGTCFLRKIKDKFTQKNFVKYVTLRNKNELWKKVFAKKHKKNWAELPRNVSKRLTLSHFCTFTHEFVCVKIRLSLKKDKTSQSYILHEKSAEVPAVKFPTKSENNLKYALQTVKNHPSRLLFSQNILNLSQNKSKVFQASWK